MKISNFKLERYFAKYEFSTSYSLCSSDCESLTLKELINYNPNLKDSLDNLYLGYTESSGHPDLKKEISYLYQNGISEHVLVCSGAQEAIFLIFTALFKKDDHIIVQFPSYQSLYAVAQSKGVNVTLWEMQSNLNWELDLAILENSITASTKAIVINYPHNPTGAMVKKSVLNKILDIAIKHDLLIISDEVYRFSEFDSNRDQFSIYEEYENSISIGVMSKSFGLAGLRIGWVISRNSSYIEKISSLKDYTTICNSGVSEIIAISALQSKKLILDKNLALIRKNVQILNEFMKKNSNNFAWIKPIAGTTAFPKMKFVDDIYNLAKDLRERISLLILPGKVFNYNLNYFRIGYGRKNFEIAIEMFSEYIETHIS